MADHRVLITKHGCDPDRLMVKRGQEVEFFSLESSCILFIHPEGFFDKSKVIIGANSSETLKVRQEARRHFIYTIRRESTVAPGTQISRLTASQLAAEAGPGAPYTGGGGTVTPP